MPALFKAPIFRTATIAVFAASAALAAAVDSTLIALIPPEATVLSSVSVDQAKNSVFGQYLLSQMQMNDPGYQQFITETGFDPRHDLSIVMSATSGDSTANRSLILGRGSFNAGRITSAAQAAGAKVTNYKGVDLLIHSGTDMMGAIAFLDANTAVVGDVQSVQAVIDRRGRPAGLPAAVIAQVNALAASNDAWFLSTVSPSAFFSGKIDNPKLGGVLDAGLAQSVLAGNGGLRFSANGATVSGQAVARSPQDANALADVFRFLINIVQANRGTSAEAGKFASMLDTLQITTQGNNMNLSLSIPEATLEQLFMGGAGGKRAGARQQASR